MYRLIMRRSSSVTVASWHRPMNWRAMLTIFSHMRELVSNLILATLRTVVKIFFTSFTTYTITVLVNTNITIFMPILTVMYRSPN